MDTKIACILVDDELPGLLYLKSLCLDLPQLEVAGVYNVPEKALADKDRLQFDIAFIDIEMPGLNGLELARALGKPVIFTTAYKEYAADAFDLDAIDYLVKPINSLRLRQALDKALLFLQRRQGEQQGLQVLLNTDRGKAPIDFAAVLMVNTAPNDPRDKQLVYAGGKEVLIKNYTFSQLQQYAGAQALVRVNKKQMIALRSVQAFTNNDVTIEAQDCMLTLPLSGSYREDFLKAMGV